MSIHEKKLVKSIELNIIGTCNLVKEASKMNIKLIYAIMFIQEQKVITLKEIP